jgi:hypothetical protein
MINLIDEIEEIISYDDIDETEKLNRIVDLCNQENQNYNRMIANLDLFKSKLARLRYTLGGLPD